jgi:hypothetical protein
MRSSGARPVGPLFSGAAAGALVLACAGTSSAPPDGAPALERPLVWRDVPGTLKEDPRSQMADFVDVTPDDFVLGHIARDGCVQYTRYSGDGRRERLGGGVCGGQWIRANTAPALARPDGCGPGRPLLANLFVEQAQEDKITMRFFSHCGDAWRPPSALALNDGGRPAIATKGTLAAGKALIVYGRQDQLWGRFVSFSGEGSGGPATVLGDPVMLQQLSARAVVFSTDLIYNAHSDRFIVGYVERVPFVLCRIKNLLVPADAPAPAAEGDPTEFGECDWDTGGHHTSAAYNPLDDGTYVWWRQDMVKLKHLFVHDARGKLTGLAPHNTNLGGNGTPWTVPVSIGRDPSLRYLAVAGWSSALTALGAEGTWTPLHGYGEHRQVAVRAVGRQVVAAHFKEIAFGVGDVLVSLSAPP